MISQGCF
ncbi:hypothetical protein AZE42_12315, partial [Rhizopogon vesiculosus]